MLVINLKNLSQIATSIIHKRICTWMILENHQNTYKSVKSSHFLSQIIFADIIIDVFCLTRSFSNILKIGQEMADLVYSYNRKLAGGGAET